MIELLMFLKELILIRQANKKEYDIRYYWYFLNKGFKFQPYVCNKSHDLLIMSLNLNNIMF